MISTARADIHNKVGRVPSWLSRLLGWWPCVVVLVGYLLRIWHLATFSVCCDELNSLSFATRPLGDLLQALATSEPHPPFYYEFLHGWVIFAGQSELALRYPSVMFGTFGVACGYRLGREIGGRGGGVASALLFATSQYAVLQSQDARMYAALQAAVALFLVGLVRYGRRPDRSAGLVVLLGGALSEFTHYHGLLAVAAGAAPLVFLTPRRPLLARLGPLLLIVALFLPWAIFARTLFSSYRGWMDVVPPGEILSRSIKAYGFAASAPGDV